MCEKWVIVTGERWKMSFLEGFCIPLSYMKEVGNCKGRWEMGLRVREVGNSTSRKWEIGPRIGEVDGK